MRRDFPDRLGEIWHYKADIELVWIVIGHDHTNKTYTCLVWETFNKWRVQPGVYGFAKSRALKQVVSPPIPFPADEP